MQIRELAVPGAFEVTPDVHGDQRGSFHEWFRPDLLAAATGVELTVAQANTSVSSAGTLRGIHVAQPPPGQAKYVTCLHGSVFDVVVDLRVGSPTFGRWDAVLLDDVERRAVYLSEGLGHGFLSLADGSVVTYLCSSTYDPDRERTIAATDPAIGIAWPGTGQDGSPLTRTMSDRDAAAPSLAEARDRGLLPVHPELD